MLEMEHTLSRKPSADVRACVAYGLQIITAFQSMNLSLDTRIPVQRRVGDDENGLHYDKLLR